MKFAIISLTGKSSTQIVEQAKKYFDQADLLDIRNIEIRIDSDQTQVFYDKKPLSAYDCVYVRGSFKYDLLQRSLTKALYHDTYMPIKPESFSLCHNKLLTLLELQKNKISIPTTYFAATSDVAKEIFRDVTYPIIIKVPFGTQGKGVMIADSAEGARSVIDALDAFKQPYILQEYIETGATDLRVLVVGSQVYCMKRIARRGELRANIHRGGRGEACLIDPQTEQIALRSARVVKADICAIDILQGTKPAVIEVNVSPGIQGLTKATNINIADKLAKYLYEATLEFKEQKKKSVQQPLRAIETKDKSAKEIYTSLDIRNGIIRLPKLITGLSGFGMDDDIIVRVSKHKIEILEHKISKGD